MAIRIMPKNLDAVIEVDTEEELIRVAKLFGTAPAPDRDEPHVGHHQAPPPSPARSAPHVKVAGAPKAQPAPAASPEPDTLQAFMALVSRKPQSMRLLKYLKERGTATMSELIVVSGFNTAFQMSGTMAGLAKNAEAVGFDLAQIITSTRDAKGEKVYTAGPVLLAMPEDDEE